LQKNCDNIASKKFLLSQKNRIHWSRSLSYRIITSHLAYVTIIAKCLRCDAIAIPGLKNFFV